MRLQNSCSSGYSESAKLSASTPHAQDGKREQKQIMTIDPRFSVSWGIGPHSSYLVPEHRVGTGVTIKSEQGPRGQRLCTVRSIGCGTLKWLGSCSFVYHVVDRISAGNCPREHEVQSLGFCVL